MSTPDLSNAATGSVLVFPDRRAQIAAQRRRAPDMTAEFAAAQLPARGVGRFERFLMQFENPNFGSAIDWVPVLTLTVSLDHIATEEEISYWCAMGFEHLPFGGTPVFDSPTSGEWTKHPVLPNYHRTTSFRREISVEEASDIFGSIGGQTTHPIMGHFSSVDGPHYNFVSQGNSWDIRNHPDHPHIDGKKFSIVATNDKTTVLIKTQNDVRKMRQIIAYMRSKITAADAGIPTMHNRPVFG